MAGELLTATIQPHKGKYKQLTQDQLRAVLQLRKLGKSQTEIAQTLGCDQATVSRWLASLTDSRDEATAYLQAKALGMAQNVVKKGKPDVQLKALQGLGVAADGPEKTGLTIQIGIKDSDVQLTFACSTQQLTGDKQALTVDTGSDNKELC